MFRGNTGGAGTDPDRVFGAVADLAALKLRLKFGEMRDPYGLTDYERLALWLYSTVGGLGEPINRGLWRGNLSPELAAVVPFIDAAIEKLPRWTKPVYRGHIDSALPFFGLRYQSGRFRTWPGFTSTSAIAEQAFIGNVLFVISSRHGRQLMMYSSEPSEQEVILPRDWRFKCIGTRRVDGFVTVTLVDAT